MSRSLAPHALLDELVDVLAVPKPGEETPRALLVQKNRTDAALMLQSGEPVLLLAYGRSSTPGAEVEQRIAAALASEQPDVVQGFRGKVIFVGVVGGAPGFRAWEPALPRQHASLGAVLEYLHVETEAVEFGTPPPGASEALGRTRSGVRTVLRQACVEVTGRESPRHASPTELADAERTGEGTIAAESRIARRLEAVPRGVVLVVAVNVAMWIAETWFGGADSTAVLSRMGGNLGRWVREGGEWWRLLSSGYLHVGFVHLGSNAVALLLFGMQLEALLGTWRFLVLYTVALVGSEVVTALLTPDVLGVGASGGLFGLMGALAVLAWRRKHVPSLSSAALLWLALVYIVFNLFASLAPGVGLLAHAAGGAVGAVVTLVGLPTWGLPPVVSGQPEPAGWRWLYRGLAVGAVAVTGLAIVMAVRNGQPWLLKTPPATVPITLTGAPVTIDLPPSLNDHTGYHQGDGFQRFVLGSFNFDPIVVSVIVRQLPEAVTDDRLEAETEAMRAEVAAEKPEEGVQRQPPRVEVVDGRPWVKVEQRNGDVQMPRWLMLLGDQRIDVQISFAEDAPEAWRSVALGAPASITRVAEEPVPSDGDVGSK
jgi:rhomboid protease GluP